MTESVITAEPARSLREIAVLMRERNVGSVVLVDGSRPVGFITDRDLALSVVADGRDAASRAGDHASTPVITAEPDMDVEEAAEKMIRHGVRRLVVVEAGRSRASSRSTTSPRAPATAPRSCRRGSRGQRCPTTSSTRAESRSLRERPDHRVRAGAVAGQLGLEERAEEERVVVELERARRAVVVVGAEDRRPPVRATST